MTDVRVAFLTGQSDPGRCGLAPRQRAFLDALATSGVELVGANFPWRGQPRDWRAVALLPASLANARQYLAARLGRVAAAADARAWLAEAPRTLLLVGSSGLAILDALAPAADVRARLRLFAFGAVGPRWPAGVAGCRVLARGDRLARWLGPAGGPAPHAIEGGHLDYLESPRARALAREELERLRADALARS